MQSLYETHKVLTYPRTDSRYLTKDLVPTLKERLDAVSIGPYKALAQQAKRSPLNGKLSFVNDAKVSRSPCHYPDGAVRAVIRTLERGAPHL